MNWKRVNAAGAGLSATLWAYAEFSGDINSVAFVSRISMVTMIFTFIAAWRADVPTEGEDA